MVLGDAFSKLDVCMDFELYFKVHNLVSVNPKRIILGQMINLDMIFHVVVSVYRLVKFETRPSSLLNFGMAYTFLTFSTNILCPCMYTCGES